MFKNLSLNKFSKVFLIGWGTIKKQKSDLYSSKLAYVVQK